MQATLFTEYDNKRLVEILKDGAVGVLPTDTVYGLVCSAADEAAVKRLYALKKREKKPGTVIAANIDQLVELGVTRRYLKAVEQFWPNAISILIPVLPLPNYASDSDAAIQKILTALTQGLDSLAVRIPDVSKFRELLEQTGPLLTSGLNQPNEPPANNLAQAQMYFGDTVDFYVDGGDLSDRQPSTLIRVVDDAVEVLRQGAVKLDEAGRIIKS